MSSALLLSRESLSSQIRDVLLERIMTGVLKPGDRLIELKIAAEMTTSQAPVREALRELETMGVIEVMPNKGARVRIITNQELQQLYDVRALLEGYATGIIALQGISVITRLRECVRLMKRAARDEDSMKFAEHNSEFHRIIVDATGNQILLDLWNTLNVKARTMANVARSRKNLQELAESHLEIITAIQSGSTSTAHNAAQDHVLRNKPQTQSSP